MSALKPSMVGVMHGHAWKPPVARNGAWCGTTCERIVGKPDTMKESPRSEMASPRFETAVFGCLALACFAALQLTTASLARFLQERDSSIAAMKGQPFVQSLAPTNASLISPTNMTRIESKDIIRPGPDKV